MGRQRDVSVTKAQQDRLPSTSALLSPKSLSPSLRHSSDTLEFSRLESRFAVLITGFGDAMRSMLRKPRKSAEKALARRFLLRKPE